jgi:hypothetical protein
MRLTRHFTRFESDLVVTECKCLLDWIQGLVPLTDMARRGGRAVAALNPRGERNNRKRPSFERAFSVDASR